MRISQCKNKREKKTEECDALLEQNELDIIKLGKTSEFMETETDNCTQLSMQDNSLSTEVIKKTQISSNMSNNTSYNLSKSHLNYIILKILITEKYYSSNISI